MGKPAVLTLCEQHHSTSMYLEFPCQVRLSDVSDVDHMQTEQGYLAVTQQDKHQLWTAICSLAAPPYLLPATFFL